MKKVIKIFIVACVSIYWLLTFLYNSPNNFIKIEHQKELKIFSTFFAQKWSFFAPPPQFNYKLYFTYLDENKNEIAAFEVYSSIIESKRNTRPFNGRAEMVDYTIYGSIEGVVNTIVKERTEINTKQPELNTDNANLLAVQRLNEVPEQVQGFLLLKDYAKIVGKDKMSAEKLKSVKFVTININSEEIKKFANRESKKPNVESKIITFNPYPF
ncbi:hypothetical protein [Chryseobacterium gleum]|uniref:hypothetical protein n=1 Tax=Chryseobacterium gleum TaxID=250 RepID=UPI0031DA005F